MAKYLNFVGKPKKKKKIQAKRGKKGGGGHSTRMHPMPGWDPPFKKGSR